MMGTAADSTCRLHFQAGGTLGEGAFYVARAIDERLTELLAEHRYCHVLAPRQIGKSSLALRARNALKERGVRCANVDLTALGAKGVKEDDWLYSIARRIAEGVDFPEKDLDAFWQGAKSGTPLVRWGDFLRTELLAEIKGDVVVFIDEIDKALDLPFPVADFLSAIRALYNDRGEHRDLERLTFCLVGVATEDKLTANTKGSPFNVGTPIVMDDFSREQLDVLLPGLSFADDPPALLDAVFAWTEGHPYMTQRICEELADGYVHGAPAGEQVERVVRACFIDGGRNSDPNLKFAERYLSTEYQSVPLTSILHLYRRVLEEGTVRAEWGGALETHLWLSGVVGRRRTATGIWLRPRNRIFGTLFNLEWVKSKETELFFAEPLLRWLNAGPRERNDHVLRGAALKRALSWAHERHEITKQEADFLQASQAVEVARARARTWVAIFFPLAVLGICVALVRADRADRRMVELGSLYQHWERRHVAGHEVDAFLEGIKLTATRGARLPETPARAIELLADGLMNYRDVVLFSHPDLVWAAAFTPDGSRVLTAANDGFLRIWSTREPSARPIEIRASQKPLRTVAVSPDARWAASAGDEPAVTLWDVAAHRSMGRLEGHTDVVNFVAFSPDGARLATASEDRRVMVWDVRKMLSGAKTAELVYRIDAEGAVNEVRFSSDGSLLVTAGEDTTARIFRASDGKGLHVLQGHRSSLLSATFFKDTEDKERVLTSDDNGAVIVWSFEDQRQIMSFVEPGGGVKRAQISTDRTLLATAGADAVVRIHDARKGTLVATLRGHRRSVLDLAFSGDGSQLVTASSDRTARVWDTHVGRPLLELKGHRKEVDDVAYSHDGERIVSASADHQVMVWSARTGDRLRVLEGHEGAVSRVLFTPDDKRLVSASEDGTARLWIVETGKAAVLSGHEGAVLALALSPDGKRVATGGKDGTVRLWSAEDGAVLGNKLDKHPAKVNCVAFSPDGFHLVSGDAKGGVRLWNQETGDFIELRGPKENHVAVRAVAFSPDGAQVVAAGNDAAIRLWDVKSGALRETSEEHSFNVLKVQFSPDGTQVASASWDGTAVLWKPLAKAASWLPLDNGGHVISLAFAPDGTRLATGSQDAHLWDARSGERLATLSGATTGLIVALAFSPDGRHLAAASDDGVARVYAATPEGLLTQACRFLRDRPRFAEVARPCAEYLDKSP